MNAFLHSGSWVVNVILVHSIQPRFTCCFEYFFWQQSEEEAWFRWKIWTSGTSV